MGPPVPISSLPLKRTCPISSPQDRGPRAIDAPAVKLPSPVAYTLSGALLSRDADAYPSLARALRNGGLGAHEEEQRDLPTCNSPRYLRVMRQS